MDHLFIISAPYFMGDSRRDEEASRVLNQSAAQIKQLCRFDGCYSLPEQVYIASTQYTKDVRAAQIIAEELGLATLETRPELYYHLFEEEDGAAEIRERVDRLIAEKEDLHDVIILLPGINVIQRYIPHFMRQRSVEGPPVLLSDEFRGVHFNIENKVYQVLREDDASHRKI